MAASDFDSKTDHFLKWFKSHPGTTFSESIQIVDLRSRNAGRGIVASRDIPAETVLFTIPRSMIINAETYDLPARLDFGLDGGLDPAKRQDFWGRLILILMHEFFLEGDTHWQPYMNVLPTSFETPMFWSESELAELQASATRSKIGKDASESMFRDKILPTIRKYPDDFPSSWKCSDEELIQLAHRMGSTIMAYAFDFEKEEHEEDEDEDEEWEEDQVKTVMGMVPMADILNADAEFNVRVNYEFDKLTVCSVRPIQAGEEILNYYGPHPNSELLRRYGYISVKHSRYDVVELPWSMIQAAAVKVLNISTEHAEKAREYMMAKIEEEGEEMEDVFVLERECEEVNPDGTFGGPATFNAMPEDLQEQLKLFLKAIRKVSSSSSSSILDKRRRDEEYAAIMLEAIHSVQRLYPTSIFEDEQLLLRHDIEGRRRMAIVVRLGEKMLLHEAREYFAAALAAADGDAGSDGQYKRLKRSD